ncbi:MAG: DUF4358 domain-containing protein [Clostridia bacterium]|nr:DUF4358 domain-containing protein [Clostridia bacterium]
MKILNVILSLVFCLFILAGCGESEAPNTMEISNSIKSLSAETVVWTALDKTSFEPYFGITEKGITEFSGFINSSEEKFDMIAVFKYEDSDTRDAILDGFYSLTRQMSDNYRIANENEVTKISEPIIAECGNTIILCIMDSGTKVNNYLENELNAEIIS